MARKVRTQTFTEPLDSAKTARVTIDPGDGNLSIDSLTSGEPLLVSGELEYLENQGLPIRSIATTNGQAVLSWKASSGKQPWLRLPWTACNGATTWQVHLNTNIRTDITAHSDGGNIQLNLASLQVTHLVIDNGGGNIDIALPEHAANLDVTAKTGAGAVSIEIANLTGSNHIEASSGAGNVAVRLPVGMAARIHATSGMGKVVVDPCFHPIEKSTYQSPEYDRAADRLEIILNSGAGNVTIHTKAAG